MFKKNPLVVSVMLALSLSACGGGGGSTDPSTPTTPTTTTLGGVSSKGIVNKGVVTAYELRADGSKIATPVGTAVTDDKGTYTLALSSAYTGGAILIELTAAADTELKCDASAGCGAAGSYGEWMAAPADFKMTAIAPPASTGSSVSVQVTPYSHMAAAAAIKEMADGVSPATAVSDAVTQVNSLVGVNILTTPPVDITATDFASASSEAQQYAIFNAAFADLVGSGDVQTVLDAYASEFSDGDFDGGTTYLEDLLAKVDDEIDDTKNSGDLSQETTDDISQLVSLIESQMGDDGSYDPEPADNTALTEVEKAKELVQETRTWLTSFSELKTPATAFAGEAETVAKALSYNSGAVLESSTMAVVNVLGNTLAAIKTDGSVPANSSITTSDGTTFTRLWQAEPTISFTLSTEDINGVKFSYTVTLDQPLSSLTDEDSLAGKTVSGTIVGSSSNTEIAITLNAALTMSFTADTTATATVTALTFNGGISLANPAGDEVAGAANIEFVSRSTSDSSLFWESEQAFSQLNLSRFKLGDMTVKTASGSSTGFAADLKIDNAATFDALSFLKGNNYVWIDKCLDGDVTGFTALANSYGIIDLWDQHYSPQGLTWASGNTTVLNGYDQDYIFRHLENNDVPENAATVIQGAYPSIPTNTTASLLYSEIHYYGSSLYWGCDTKVNLLLDMDSQETAESFMDASLTLTGQLALAGYPAANASVILDRTGLNAATASVMLSYNGKLLDIDLSKSATSPNTGVLEVTNANGDKLIVNVTDDESSVSGTVTVDSQVVGTITDGILRYNDGTFESLN